MNAECNQLVGIGDLQSFGAKRVDESLVHPKDAERDQLVGIQIAEMLTLHLPRKCEAHVLHRHSELLLFVHIEAQRLHLARIIRRPAGNEKFPRLHRPSDSPRIQACPRRG